MHVAIRNSQFTGAVYLPPETCTIRHKNLYCDLAEFTLDAEGWDDNQILARDVPKAVGILLQPRAGRGSCYRGGCCRQRLLSLQRVPKKQSVKKKAHTLLEVDNWVAIDACRGLSDVEQSTKMVKESQQ
jgi:hypothetical protein